MLGEWEWRWGPRPKKNKQSEIHFIMVNRESKKKPDGKWSLVPTPSIIFFKNEKDCHNLAKWTNERINVTILRSKWLKTKSGFWRLQDCLAGNNTVKGSSSSFLLMDPIDTFETYDYVLSGRIHYIASRTILHGHILDEATQMWNYIGLWTQLEREKNLLNA